MFTERLKARFDGSGATIKKTLDLPRGIKPIEERH
jgi:hypothetical protein